MKKIMLALGLAVVGAAVLYAATLPSSLPEAEPVSIMEVSNDTGLTTMEQELNEATLEDFDKEIQNLDQSIKQL